MVFTWFWIPNSNQHLELLIVLFMTLTFYPLLKDSFSSEGHVYLFLASILILQLRKKAAPLQSSIDENYLITSCGRPKREGPCG